MIQLVAETSPFVGLGHVSRMAALARTLQTLGHAAMLHVEGGPVPGSLVEGVELGQWRSPAVVIRDFRTAWPARPSMAFTVDLVDEVGDESGEADATFAMLGAPLDESYHVGLEFAVMSEAFALPPLSPEARHGAVISMGSDAMGRGLAIEDALREVFPPSPLDGAVTGVTRVGGGQWIPPHGVARRVRGATVAITSGGMSLPEALACGTPVLALAHNEREAQRIAEYARRGLVHDCGFAADVDLDALARLAVMRADVGSLGWHRVAARGRAAVDARGANRVAVKIAKLSGIGSDGVTPFVSEGWGEGYQLSRAPF